jgi:hypothetical protein
MESDADHSLASHKHSFAVTSSIIMSEVRRHVISTIVRENEVCRQARKTDDCRQARKMVIKKGSCPLDAQNPNR